MIHIFKIWVSFSLEGMLVLFQHIFTATYALRMPVSVSPMRRDYVVKSFAELHSIFRM